jgi:hypothetical protein
LIVIDASVLANVVGDDGSDGRRAQRSAYGHQSMDSQQAAAARALAGNPDNEEPA